MTKCFFFNNTTYIQLRILPAHQHVLVKVSACNEQMFVIFYFFFIFFQYVHTHTLKSHKDTAYIQGKPI